MPKFTKGKLEFEHKETGRVTGSRDLVEKFSCYPPPGGERSGANPVLVINPHEPSNHIQPEEKRRIEKFAVPPGRTAPIATVIKDVKTAFKINPLTIDLTKVPKAWRRADPCYDHSIYVEVESVLLRIDVVAKQDLTLDNVTWPTGDSVAQFRIIVPDRYRFVKVRTRNINCCPLNDGEALPPPQTETGDWSASNFTPFSYDWKFRLDMRYRLDDYWLRPGYWKKFDFDEPSEEDQPDQPWIFPKFKYKF